MILKNNKAVGGAIPVKIFKNSGYIFDILQNFINQSTETSNFTDCLKTTNNIPVFKEYDPRHKLNSTWYFTSSF